MSMPIKKVGVASLFPKRACNHLVLPWWNIVLDRCYDFELKSGSARGRKIVIAKVEPILVLGTSYNQKVLLPKIIV